LRTTAIVVAAGRGTRLGGHTGKALLPLAGQPMLVYSLRTLSTVPEVTALVLVVAADERRQAESIVGARAPWRRPICIAVGGAERQDSVAAGLAAVDLDADLVLVHDAARPFVTPDCVAACVAAAASSGAAIAALPATDTVKVTDAEGWVVDTPDRSRLFLAQTPQVFRTALLREAYRRAAEEGRVTTDDAALVEALGHRVQVVPGNQQNRKVTTPDDWRWADWYARSADCVAGQDLVRS
jgi:2-C-methyl-D-erythritol 4-phosphate cytidylyltransferase